VAAAEQVRQAAGLDEVWLVPNALPPHRSPPPLASAADRLAMAQLAVSGHPGLRVSDIELHRPGPSYTIDTLKALGRRYPRHTFALLLGADAARSIASWHAADRLLRDGAFIIFNRSGSSALTADDLARSGFPPNRTQTIEIDSPAISAHHARSLLRNGGPVLELLDPAVLDYIQAHGLYQG
jgi:nicotinate-nucleotide adenylyltransferase